MAITQMQIGEKIRRLRTLHGLTQEELAARTDLSKGFISQLERDLTSPSIATLIDMLEALGTNLQDFFNERTEEKIVFEARDIFEKSFREGDAPGYVIEWLVANAQKNRLEPILVTIDAGGRFQEHDAHEGEEFGYVLSGQIALVIGGRRVKAKKGDSFCFRPTAPHWAENTAKAPAKILWVSSPPSF